MPELFMLLREILIKIKATKKKKRSEKTLQNYGKRLLKHVFKVLYGIPASYECKSLVIIIHLRTNSTNHITN